MALNLDQYVGKTIHVCYASPRGELQHTGFVQSSNERMALSLRVNDEVLTIPCYRIQSIEIVDGLPNYLTQEQINKLLKQNNLLYSNHTESISPTPYYQEDIDFSFKDLIKLDDRSLQLILRKLIAQNNLHVIPLAIKQENELFINRVLQNMSKRMREEIMKELHITRENNVEDRSSAQLLIVDLVKHYAKNGEILPPFST